MEPIVGIDLGTTNSEIAYILDESAQVLKDDDDGIFPSCVGLDADGQVIVGAEARNQAALEPERTILSVKRQMGREKTYKLGDQEYRPQEIAAFILRALKARGEKVLGRAVNKAVITVPAYFTDAQRQATREAGEIAGLEVVRIINEPTAAAIAYERDQGENQQVLVFDLGGGTFDVSIVRIEANVVEVMASTGDNYLGGDDFDQKIADWLAEYCEAELNIQPREDRLLMSRLRRAAEKAKIALSDQPYVTIEEDHIGTRRGKPVHLSRELSRIAFEEMIAPELSRTMDSVGKALKDAGLLPGAIDEIILVGGSTRIPAISTMLEEKFGHLPHSEIDPDLCVALGAAIQAGREMGRTDAGVLLDVTPYTFGTSAIAEMHGRIYPHRFVPLIRRNTKLPAHKSESFATVYDNQEQVDVTVYQGEEPDALDNILIGKYRFDLTPAPAGSLIILDFELDINGILKIRAEEKDTGKQISAVIENAMSRFDEEELAASRERIASMWGEAPADEDAEVIEPDFSSKGPEMPAELAEIVKQAKAKLKEAESDDQEEMINLIEDIEDAVRENRLEDARNASQELEDILFYLG